MIYSLNLSLYRLKRNLKTYSVIILQMCIGFMVLFTVLNVDFSMKSRLEILSGDVRDAEIRVDIMNSSVEDGAFRYHAYEEMGNIPGCDTGIMTAAVVMAVIDKNPDNVIIVCAPDRYYRDLFSDDMKENQVYCSRNLYDDIHSGRVILYGNGTDIRLSEDGCTVNGQSFGLSVINDTRGITEISRDEYPGNSYKLDRMMFFPQEAGAEWEDESFVSYSLWFYPETPGHYTDAYKAVYRNLKGVSFRVCDPAASLMKKCQDINDVIGIMTLISAALLTITFIGTVGVLMINVYNRRKDIAVAVSVGASPEKLRLELFAEVTFVCLAGISAGAAGAAFLTNIMRSAVPFFDIGYSVHTIITASASAVLAPAAVTALSLSGYGGINVITLLRGEE